MFTLVAGVAQTFEGRVLDSRTKQPLEKVNIYVDNTEVGTTTNNKGEFKLQNVTRSFSDSLTFSIIGYKVHKVPLANLKEKSTTILLEELTNELEEVVISGRRKLREKLRYYKLSSMKKGLYAFGCTLINNSIYVIGGSKSFIENTMRRAIDDAYANCPDCGFLAILDELEPNASYQGYNNNLLVYDINLDEWNINEIDFIDRENHQIHVYNNRLYALGGKKNIQQWKERVSAQQNRNSQPRFIEYHCG